MELNKLYSYEINGEEKMGLLEAIIPKNGVKHAILDNGDSIALDRFQLIAQVIQNNPNEENHENTNHNDFHIPIKFDQKTGLPILDTDDKGGGGIKHAIKHHHTQENGLHDVVAPEVFDNSNPIYLLLNKAKLSEETIDIKIPLKFIDKNLYNTIVTSFENSETAIFDFLAQKIDLENLKSLVAEELKKKYL